MSRVIVTKGEGDEAFFKELLKAHRLIDFTVFKRNNRNAGSGAFRTMLEAIKAGTEFEDATLVVLVADCDAHPANEFNKVIRQIKQARDYAVPSRPREVAVEERKKSTSVLMLPWDEEIGCLETICYDLAAKRKPQLAGCIDEFVQCIQIGNWKPQQREKLRMRCLLSARCPRDPNTPLKFAWSGNRRPKDLIPLKRRNKLITRIVGYLKSLP